MSDAVMVPRGELEDFAHVMGNLIGEVSDPGTGALAAHYRLTAMLAASPSDAVMVPREPTEAMIAAADCAGMAFAGSDLDSADMTRMIWSAMLAASPSVGGWEDISTAPKDGVTEAECLRIDQLPFDLAMKVYRALDFQRRSTPPPVSTGSRPQEAVPSEQAEPAVVGDDGWIEWSGGENPVPGQRVDTRFRGDPLSEGSNDPSGMWTWEHAGDDGDIIAYRILPQTEKGS